MAKEMFNGSKAASEMMGKQHTPAKEFQKVVEKQGKNIKGEEGEFDNEYQNLDKVRPGLSYDGGKKENG
jgi:hypothetical protein